MAKKGRPRLSAEAAYEKYLGYISEMRSNRFINKVGIMTKEMTFENFKRAYIPRVRDVKPNADQDIPRKKNTTTEVIKKLAKQSVFAQFNERGRPDMLKPGQTINYGFAHDRAKEVIKANPDLFPEYAEYSTKELTYMIMSGQINYIEIAARAQAAGISEIEVERRRGGRLDKYKISIWGSTIEEIEE